MAITASIKYKGVRADAQSAEVVYLVVGDGADAGNVSDGDAFDAVFNSTPTTWNGIPGANVDVRNELIQGTIWEVAATYSTQDPVVYQQSSIDYEFSFQAPQEKIYQSISTVGAYSVNGPIDPDTFGGAINVTKSNGETNVDGLDLPTGNPTNTWVYQPLHADVTTAYQMGVEAVMGDVNTTPIFTRAAGTMRLVSCDGGALFSAGSYPKWKIRFGFQFSRHRYNFNVGGIDIPFKGGHNLLWGYYEDDIHTQSGDSADNGKKTVLKKPKFMFVEQIYFESNLRLALGIG